MLRIFATLYLHTYIYTYIHTCIHAYIHAYMRTCIYSLIDTFAVKKAIGSVVVNGFPKLRDSVRVCVRERNSPFTTNPTGLREKERERETERERQKERDRARENERERHAHTQTKKDSACV